MDAAGELTHLAALSAPAALASFSEPVRRWFVGLDQVAWGLLLFALAAAISLAKSGAWRAAIAPKKNEAFDP